MKGVGDIEKLRFSTPGVVMKGSGDIDLASMDFGFRMEGQVNNEIAKSTHCAQLISAMPVLIGLSTVRATWSRKAAPLVKWMWRASRSRF